PHQCLPSFPTRRSSDLLGGFAVYQLANLPRYMAPHLDCGLGQLRQGLVIDEGDVTGCKYSFILGRAQIWMDANATALTLFQTPVTDFVPGGDPAGPDRDSGRQLLVVPNHYRIGPHLFHGGV